MDIKNYILKTDKNVVTGGIEGLILEKSVLMNVKKKRTLIIKAHEKKLKNLSKNFILPFTSEEVITNLSNYQLSDTKRDLLKYGLYHMQYHHGQLIKLIFLPPLKSSIPIYVQN